MESSVDQDQQWLLNCLSATLDPNHEVRSFAEASLHQASLQPGFGSALSRVAANREVPFGLRQLAAVLLKQFIKKHWQEGGDSFKEPAVSSDEKAVIRKYVLLSLDDSHRKICTAISIAIAAIAVYDWPDLLPHLVKLIKDQTNMNDDLYAELTIKKNTPSQQIMALHAESFDGSAPTSYFINGLGNGSLTGSMMHSSPSSSQLAKESPFMLEISVLARGQRQIIHQLENLSSFLRESYGKAPKVRTN